MQEPLELLAQQGIDALIAEGFDVERDRIEKFRDAIARKVSVDELPSATSVLAAAFAKGLADAGLVIVPKEPTEAMIEAGMDADTKEWRRSLGARLPTVEEAQANEYRAMIEAVVACFKHIGN